MTTSAQTAIKLDESAQIEFGDIEPSRATETSVSSFIISSYNIRYRDGPHLISGGLLRNLGLGRNGCPRPHRSGQNIHTAAEAFSAGRLLPRVDVLALQEADKETTRAGRIHIARELAQALKMSWIHVPSGLPRGVPPKERQW